MRLLPMCILLLVFVTGTLAWPDMRDEENLKVELTEAEFREDEEEAYLARRDDDDDDDDDDEEDGDIDIDEEDEDEELEEEEEQHIDEEEEDDDDDDDKKRDADEAKSLERRASAVKYTKVGCLKKYKDISPDHTMCTAKDSKDLDKDHKKTGISSSEIDDILDLHDKVRESVGAANMAKCVWDPDASDIAQKLAQTCKLQHDKIRNIPSFGGVVNGQNIAKTCDSEAAIKAWEEEKEKFKYGKNVKGTGHFSQEVQAIAFRVGCGRARCGKSCIFVCNYSYGQTKKQCAKPYIVGKPCSKCSGKCKNGLCECKNSEPCYYNQKTTDDPCKCKCNEHLSGDRCEKVKCAGPDEKGCGSGKLKKGDCVKLSSVVKRCPRLCGIPCGK